MTETRGSADLRREQLERDRAVWEQGFRAGTNATLAAAVGNHDGYVRASRCPYQECVEGDAHVCP